MSKIVTVDTLKTFYTKIKTLIDDKSKVTVSQGLTSGTKVGTVIVDGVSTDLYCQSESVEFESITNDEIDEIMS